MLTHLQSEFSSSRPNMYLNFSTSDKNSFPMYVKSLFDFIFIDGMLHVSNMEKYVILLTNVITTNLFIVRFL